MLFQRLLKPKRIIFEELSPNQLHTWLEDDAKDFCLLDVRTPEEYKNPGPYPWCSTTAASSVGAAS